MWTNSLYQGGSAYSEGFRWSIHLNPTSKDSLAHLWLRRQSCKRTTNRLMVDQGLCNHPKNRKKALAAQRKLKTIAGRLLRVPEKKLPAASLSKYANEINIYQRILNQKKNSIHEPQVYCISKGKDHKKYEFGSKASIVMTKNSGVIVRAVSFSQNVYDGHTLPEALTQTADLVGPRAKVAICDR